MLVDFCIAAIITVRLFDKRCCLREKQVKTWPIEIVLRVTPPLKVHVLSRWLAGSACARRSLASLYCSFTTMNHFFGISSNERVKVVSLLSVDANNMGTYAASAVLYGFRLKLTVTHYLC